MHASGKYIKSPSQGQKHIGFYIFFHLGSSDLYEKG